MRIRFLLFTFLFFIARGYSQSNLVPNPDLEAYSQCPHFPPDGNINKAVPWFQPWPNANSSDYFNICDTVDLYMSVPLNFVGFQYPHSGNGFIGILCGFLPIPNPGREYLEVELTDTLESGKIYNVSFYTSLSDSSHFAIDNVGVAFSDTLISYDPFINSDFLLSIPYALKSGSVISDTLNWTYISGKYNAHGGEKYLLVGNFLNDASTIYQPTGVNVNNISYYYFDDFNVSLDTTTSVQEIHLEAIEISPNPVSNGTVKIIYLLPQNQDGELAIYNTTGQVVYRQPLPPWSTLQYLDVSHLGGGLYSCVIRSGAEQVVKKLVIVK